MKLYFLALTTMLFTMFACKDDEIDPVVGEPRLLSYKSVSGNFKLRAEYEYDSEGRIKRISRKRSTPGTTQRVDEFTYDDNGKVTEQIRSMSGAVQEKTTYTWDKGHIGVSTIYNRNNIIIGFSFYDYNQFGQLKKVETYRGEGNVGFLRTDSIGFTYHADGNLFKMIKYTGDNSGVMTLLSTQTFPEYFSSPNPVATVEILPIVKLQRELPKGYVVADIDDNSFSYSIQYDLRKDGYPRKRIVTSVGAVEQTVYTYVH
jgi:YD repeat-containing protein